MISHATTEMRVVYGNRVAIAKSICGEWGMTKQYQKGVTRHITNKEEWRI